MNKIEILIYECLDCRYKWQDDYNPDYGYCDDKCPHCGNVYSPEIQEVIE